MSLKVRGELMPGEEAESTVSDPFLNFQPAVAGFLSAGNNHSNRLRELEHKEGTDNRK